MWFQLTTAPLLQINPGKFIAASHYRNRQSDFYCATHTHTHTHTYIYIYIYIYIYGCTGLFWENESAWLYLYNMMTDATQTTRCLSVRFCNDISAINASASHLVLLLLKASSDTKPQTDANSLLSPSAMSVQCCSMFPSHTPTFFGDFVWFVFVFLVLSALRLPT